MKVIIDVSETMGADTDIKKLLEKHSIDYTIENDIVKKKCIPSKIEDSTIEFLEDIIKEAKDNLNSWEECQLYFEVLSEIQRAIATTNIDLLMQIEFVYRNEGMFTLHEQINDIVNTGVAHNY